MVRHSSGYSGTQTSELSPCGPSNMKLPKPFTPCLPQNEVAAYSNPVLTPKRCCHYSSPRAYPKRKLPLPSPHAYLNMKLSLPSPRAYLNMKLPLLLTLCLPQNYVAATPHHVLTPKLCFRYPSPRAYPKTIIIIIVYLQQINMPTF